MQRSISQALFFIEEMNLNMSIKEKGDLSIEEQQRLNLLALLPCPIKCAVENAFENYIELENIKFDCLIESNANNNLKYDEYIKKFKTIDDIPDIVITSGLNNFYGQEFKKNFIDKGYFESVAINNPIDKLKEIKDPKGVYTIIAVNLLVIVVNLERIGELPMPDKWEDLLSAEFENKVVIRGEQDKFCETTLLIIFKEYGEDGVRKLGRSVVDGWHPAQMVKSIAKNSQEGPVISVMPYFFTKTISNQEKVKIIWPKEGAIVSPVTMLVKKSKAKKLQKLIKFFLEDEVGEICVRSDFPSLNPKVNLKLPKEACFNWIGWDFIDKYDVTEVVEVLNKIFSQSFHEKNN